MYVYFYKANNKGASGLFYIWECEKESKDWVQYGQRENEKERMIWLLNNKKRHLERSAKSLSSNFFNYWTFTEKKNYLTSSLKANALWKTIREKNSDQDLEKVAKKLEEKLKSLK